MSKFCTHVNICILQLVLDGVKIVLPVHRRKSFDLAKIAFDVLRSFTLLFFYLIMFRAMTYPTPDLLDGVCSLDHRVASAYVLWFDARNVMDNNIIVQYIRGGQLLDDKPLFALDYDKLRLHMCALNDELKAPKLGFRSTRERFVQEGGDDSGMLGGCVVTDGSWPRSSVSSIE